MRLETLSDAELDRQIHTAHDRQDGDALTLLYGEAANRKAATGETDASLYLLTQAYVFALEAGHASAGPIHRSLLRAGREA